jgi:hypothetical protein
VGEVWAALRRRDPALAWRQLRGIYRRTRRRALWPLRRRRIERSLEILRPAPSPAATAVPCVVVALVRDNEHIIEPFLDHYLRLGVARIVLLDNGSRDDTVPRALRCDQVELLRCTLPFHAYEAELKRFLIERYGDGRWCLLADVDELFDYPASEQLPFAAFLEYLDERQFTAVVALLLDLFADGPVETWPEGGRELIEACVWYDPASYRPWHFPWLRRINRFADPEMPLWQGGIREKLLGRRTVTTKFPLLKYHFGGRLQLRELEHTSWGACVADVSAVLRHYKFDRLFLERWRLAAERGRHGVHIKDYRAAQDRIAGNPGVILRGPTARRLLCVDQLVDDGLLCVSDAYRAFVEGRRR